MVVGGSQRLDQARAGVSAFQPAWAGEGAVRVGPGVPGVERQAPAAADGGVEGGRSGSRRRQIDADRGLWRAMRPARTAIRHLFANYRKSIPPCRPAKSPRHRTQVVGRRLVLCRKSPAAQTPSAVLSMSCGNANSSQRQDGQEDCIVSGQRYLQPPRGWAGCRSFPIVEYLYTVV